MPALGRHTMRSDADVTFRMSGRTHLYGSTIFFVDKAITQGPIGRHYTNTECISLQRKCKAIQGSHKHTRLPLQGCITQLDTAEL